MKLRKIIETRFFRDGATLLGGNLWAQGIAFAAYFLIVRLYSSQDIGLYNIFYSYIEVLIVLSTCRYEQACVIAPTDGEAVAVGRLALRMNVVFSLVLVLITIVIIVVGPQSIGMDGTMQAGVLMLIPPMVYLCGTSRVYTALLNRFRGFGQIAVSEAVGSTGGVVLKTLFGLPRLVSTVWHSIGLPLGTVLGKAASNVNLLMRLRKMELPRSAGRAERRAVAVRYRNFALYTTPKDLVNSLSYNLPFIWLALLFDKGEVGLLGLALTFTFRPVNILNNVFDKLLYVRVAERVRSGQSVMRDLRRFLMHLMLPLLPVFAVVFFYGDSIFGFLFGARWSSCGYYLRCLLPWVYIMLGTSSLGFLSNVFSRQRSEFVFYIVLFVMRIASMVAGIVAGSFRIGILCFALSGAVVSASLLVWYLLLVRRYEESVVSCER